MIPYTYVYIIWDRASGLYKIGRSDNPAKRLEDLSREATKHPTERDYVLADAWLARPESEAILHKQFTHLRVRGEWFRLDYDELYEIEQYFYRSPRFNGSRTVEVENLEIDIWRLQQELNPKPVSDDSPIQILEAIS